VNAHDATAALAERAGTRVVEASPLQAVVVQGNEPALANHVGVRHASALYLATLEASRQLAVAVAGERGAGNAVDLVESDIRYGAVPTGTIVCTAAPLQESLAAGAVQVRVVAETAGRVVARMTARWRIGGQEA